MRFHIVAVVMAIVLAGCLHTGTEPSSPDGDDTDGTDQQVDRTIYVNGTSFEFDPSTIQTQQNQTIEFIFRNTDSGTPHDLVIPSLNVGTNTISGGETGSFVHIFSEPGSYQLEFICSVPGHESEGMVGTIQVS